MTVRRARAGDVLEIVAPAGFVYVHALGKHATYGDAIAVCRAIQPSRTVVSSALFEDAYVTFYPASHAVRQGLATIVGNLPPPNIPPRFRRAGVIEGRAVLTWILEDDAGDVLRHRLSAEERKLPIAAIWNHAMLLQRVAEGWRPDQDVGAPAPDVPVEVPTTPRTPQATRRHYLYFSTERVAADVAARLQQGGLRTEFRLGADGVNWLVLAHEALAGTETTGDAVEQALRKLAHELGGEYDGSEVELSGDA